MSVVTRFAPSPTGFLHIGGARTALFNYLYAKHHQGKFLLRIEDTDRDRSTQAAVDAIIEGLAWFGLQHDGEIVFQSSRSARHVEIAKELLRLGGAYYCYCNAKKEAYSRDGVNLPHRCQCRTLEQVRTDTMPVIRLKSPQEGTTTFIDEVYGEVSINNQNIDDIVILRSDQTPTYGLAVVVDDHDMEVTQIIRGTDHLTNTSRQIVLYNALSWQPPKFAHIPLIHDEQGNKLSKRHGAIGLAEYEKMGILPEALRNYLLRLGWSHGNHEIISDEQAIAWFGLNDIGLSPACLDPKKLEHLNNHYIKNSTLDRIISMVTVILENKLSRQLTNQQKTYLYEGLDELKSRAKTINQLAELAMFYAEDLPITLDFEAKEVVKSGQDTIKALVNCLSEIDDWSENTLKVAIKGLSSEQSNVYHCLRAPLTGYMNAPSIIRIAQILGKKECIKRLEKVLIGME